MGAALSYARRYALFALVGIAGEDDLDAPDLEPIPIASPATAVAGQNGKLLNGVKPNGAKPKPARAMLGSGPSAALRDQLVAEIGNLKSEIGLEVWAKGRLPAKNTLVAEDAQAVESAYLSALAVFDPALRTSESAENEGQSGGPRSERGGCQRPIGPTAPQGGQGPLQGASAVRGRPTLPGLQEVTVRPAPISDLPSHAPWGGKSATNSPCRCAASITRRCTVTATRSPGGPILSLCQWRWQRVYGRRRARVRWIGKHSR
jgi:hypothetical protein